MSILIHLVKHSSGYELVLPTPENKGGVPGLRLLEGDEYLGSYLLPCGFEDAMNYTRYLRGCAAQVQEPLRLVQDALEEYRQKTD